MSGNVQRDVQILKQDYKSHACVAVMVWASLVNTRTESLKQTDRQTDRQTAFGWLH